jgi:hypothetical protein
MVPTFAGLLVDDPEDDVTLSQSMIAALSRGWDAQKIHDYVATKSWEEVAQRVAAQWRLTLESFRHKKSGALVTSSKDPVAGVIRSSRS